MAKYPAITAGQRLDAALLDSMLPEYVRKTVGTDRTTSTMTDDPDLSTTLVGSAVYFVEFFLLCGGTTTADIQTAWTVPSGASGFKSVMGPGSTASDSAGDNVAVRLGVHAFSTTITYSGVRNSTSSLFRVYEYGEVTTSATAGTLALNWGQATTNATASRVWNGSLLRVTRIT